METLPFAIGFFAAAFVAAVAAMVLSFSAVEWAVACGAAGGIFALAGLFFPLRKMGKDKDKK